jgi:hypothetical protein
MRLPFRPEAAPFAPSRRVLVSGLLLWAMFVFCVLLAGKGPTATGQPPAGHEPESVGQPLAPGMMELLEREMAAGLQERGIAGNFARFRAYSARMLAESARNGGSELTGNCRLGWYAHLLRHPLEAPAEAEEFTRKLHLALRGDHTGLDRALAIAGQKLDLGPQKPRSFVPVTTPEQALDMVRSALTDAQVHYAAALAPLSPSEVRELMQNLYPVLVSQNNVGHTLQSRGTGRRLCDLLEKLDRTAMHAASEDLVPLTAPDFLKQLAQLPETGDVKVAGAAGTILRRIDTPAGSIVIGGRGANTYQLDEMPGVNVVIDLGGDDIYYEGSCSYQRPVLIVIDLAGDDAYRAKRPGVQGGAILGISMLLDVAGQDVYDARDVAQGSCVGGAGILIDYAGNDVYQGIRRVQGQALAGVGILLDRAGSDSYRGALWTQGMGGPLGFAVLDDLEGKDHYYTGGYYRDSYPETPGYDGWGQGVGAGLRAVADGGIGVILDGGGDDVYEYDYLAHGGGYWCGLGFARDFGGNDRRLGATLKAYDGSPRAETRFQRFGCGWGCHYALGFCFDDAGDDTYGGTIMGSGFAWDDSVGCLCDFGGNDRYEATGGGTQGNGAQAGLGILYDYDGDDVYLGYTQANASANITYHHLPECGGNFSFVVDYGGNDQYGCGVRNNTINRRGSAGGFLIDRPRREPGEQHAAEGETPARTTNGS